MISLRFLGTGGLGSVRVRNKLSKEYRRFSSLLIDEKIIIDPSEDVFELIESFKLDDLLDGVTDVLITHSHPDHFSVSAIEKLAERKSIRVYASASVKQDVIGLKNVEYREIYSFALQKIGDFSVLPLPSNHFSDSKDEVALNFLLERDEKTVFYGLDGAFINPLAFEILKEVKLSAVILDCALGLEPYSSASVNHNNLCAVFAIRDILLASGSASETTKFVISHIPTSKKAAIHDALVTAIGDIPIKVAYDGYYIAI